MEVSLCWASTALMPGVVFSASATRSGETVSPYGAVTSTTSTPKARHRSSQRSPNLPALTTTTVSPGESVLTTAASMAPVPEHASGMTSWEVCTRRLSPASTSMKSASYSGVRW